MFYGLIVHLFQFESEQNFCKYQNLFSECVFVSVSVFHIYVLATI